MFSPSFCFSGLPKSHPTVQKAWDIPSAGSLCPSATKYPRVVSSSATRRIRSTSLLTAVHTHPLMSLQGQTSSLSLAVCLLLPSCWMIQRSFLSLVFFSFSVICLVLLTSATSKKQSRLCLILFKWSFSLLETQVCLALALTR